MSERDYLSDFEQLVMLAVFRLADDAYGGRIRRELDANASRNASIATIYVALARLEKRGYVTSWLSDPTPVRGGKAKRFYRLRPEGAAALRQARDTMAHMWKGHESALDPESLAK